MGILDNLDLSQLSRLLAPAGYTPNVMTLPGDFSTGATLNDLTSKLAPAGYTPPAPAPPPDMGASPPGGLLSGGPPPTGQPPPGPPPDQPPPPDPSQSPALAPLPDLDQAPQGANISLLRNQDSAPPPATNLTPAQSPPQGGLRGFLSGLTATDPTSGITFRDKLMALGQIMQGDTKGAQSYLQSARQNAVQLAMRQQIGQMFPNNPKMQLFMMANPGEALKLMLPQVLKKGEHYGPPLVGDGVGGGAPGQAGGAGGAPGQAGGVPGQRGGYSDVMDYGQEGGVPYVVHNDGSFTWGGARPANAAELETKARDAATQKNEADRLAFEKSSKATELAQGQQRLGIEGGQLTVAQQNAAREQAAQNKAAVTAAIARWPGRPVLTSPEQRAALGPNKEYITLDGQLARTK